MVISLLGMLLMGVSFVSGLGLGAATMVLVTMIASLTLLPALLGFAGERVEVTRWRGLIAAGFVAVALLGVGLKANTVVIISAVVIAVAVLLFGLFVPVLKREVPRRPEKPLRETFAYRWSRIVQPGRGRSPSARRCSCSCSWCRCSASGSASPTRATCPTDSSGKQAYDLLSDGFGVGFNGPLLLVTEVPEDFDASTAAPFLAITSAIAETPGVQSVSPPFPSDTDDPSASARCCGASCPTTSPQDEATTALVKRLRDDVLPEATAGTGLDVLVTGFVGDHGRLRRLPGRATLRVLRRGARACRSSC